MIAARAESFASFRDEARRLLGAGVAPDDVAWESKHQASLFGDSVAPRPSSPPTARVPAAFLEAAEIACDHADPRRFDVLYRVLWKVTHGARDVLGDPLDPDAARLRALVRDVRHDEHETHAFVRFRPVRGADGEERWVAWFRPTHDVLRRVAPFFARRYPDARWTLFTPEASAHWDGRELRFGPGAPASEAPEPDALDALFVTYYASVFNPARVNPALFARHVPSRFAAQLPEARALPALVRGAARRVDAMTSRSRPSVALPLPDTRDLASLAAAATTCRACPLGARATHTVFGEGPRDARLVIVGEQPGDEEDLAGRPFVGPAGRLLDELLARAGIDRARVYVTNAVKHFKWEPRGERRLHARPDAAEVDACHGWLLAELAAIRPAMILCLGATAAQSFAGPKFRVARDRGKPTPTPWAPWWMATYHPSALLRAEDPSARAAMEAAMMDDLARARDRWASLDAERRTEA